MGYTSTVIIAIHKSILAQDLVNPIIPTCLKNEEFSDEDPHIRYWELSWKWYAAYQEIQEIEAMFEKLQELPPLTETDEDGRTYDQPIFGALRLGEELGDIQTWGDPDHFDIYVSQTVNYPGSH